MSQIIKAFTGVFITLFLTATGVGILGAFLQTLQAQNFHGKIIDEMENSDYAITVLNELFVDVNNQGNDLEIMLFLEDGTILECDSQSELPEKLNEINMAEVTLTYSVQIPFLGLNQNYCIVGYAR